MTAPLRACGCGAGGLAPTAVSIRTERASFTLLRCPRCGRRLLDPLPSDAELAASYDAEYYGEGKSKFIAPVEAFVEHFRGVRARTAYRLLSGISRPSGAVPRVLDIGCGSGQFLARLAAVGVECHGTELSEQTARRAGAVPGLRIHVGPLEAATFAPRQFDLISIWHVLEHLPDPDAVLRACREWISPGGFLMIAVPNISSWQARLFRGAWFHLDAPRHLQHFSPESLREALQSAGFEVTRTGHLSWEQNLYGYVQSALNAMGFPRDELYGLFKGGRPASPRASIPIQAALAGVLLPSAMIATAAEAAFRAGGTLECIAVPRGRD